MEMSFKPVAFIDLVVLAGRHGRDVARVAYVYVDQIGRTRGDIRLNFVCAFRCAVGRSCNTRQKN